jgi:tRNA(Ile)-lysidine synthase
MVDTRRLTLLGEQAASLLELPQGPLVVALSGGADSAALARLIVDQGAGARTVHIDHGLPASPTMRRAAREIAGRLGLDLEIVETRVEEGPSPEGQARLARYEAFSEAVGRDEALLTAHTIEDNTETVVMNLARGTGIRGLAGIPKFRAPNIYRPALGLSRSLLREVAVLSDLPFVDDPMNLDPAVTRNRVRMTLIPRLRELNPSVDIAISRTARLLGADADFLEGLIPFPSQMASGRAGVPVGELLALPRPLADRHLVGLLGRLVGPGRVDAALVDRVWSVAQGRSGGQEVAKGIRAGLEGAFLVLSAENGFDEIDGGEIALTPGSHRHGSMVFEVLLVDSACRAAPFGLWHAIFPAGTELTVGLDGTVRADGAPAWVPGKRRHPVAWYVPGEVGYLSVFAREGSGWTSSL